MMEKTDVTYVCTHLSNLTGLPVRVYEGEVIVYYHSIVALPVDPLTQHLRDVFSVAGHVGYTVTPHEQYYGVVNFGARKLVIGPTRAIPYSDQELHEIAFESDVPNASVMDFIAGMKNLVPMPLTSVLQTLCIVNHVLNDGEKLSLTDLAIVDTAQASLVETLEKEEAEHTFHSAESAERAFPNSLADTEKYLLDRVRTGDVEGLKDFFSALPALRLGILAPNRLRNAQNLHIETATLVSREAMRGGMDAEDALTRCDRYIRQCESLQAPEAVVNLTYRLILDYAERMARLAGETSPLVSEITKYIRKHLSEPISVEALARHLCRGRSRLSTDFKQVTGENLSEFILKKKIEEGKKLLRRTDKPAVEIAFFLGFSSQSHFSRVFKRQTGMTPGEFRASARKRS